MLETMTQCAKSHKFQTAFDRKALRENLEAFRDEMSFLDYVTFQGSDERKEKNSIRSCNRKVHEMEISSICRVIELETN